MSVNSGTHIHVYAHAILVNMYASGKTWNTGQRKRKKKTICIGIMQRNDPCIAMAGVAYIYRSLQWLFKNPHYKDTYR